MPAGGPLTWITPVATRFLGLGGRQQRAKDLPLGIGQVGIVAAPVLGRGGPRRVRYGMSFRVFPEHGDGGLPWWNRSEDVPNKPPSHTTRTELSRLFKFPNSLSAWIFVRVPANKDTGWPPINA